MPDLQEQLARLLQPDNTMTLLRALSLFVVGLILARLVAGAVSRLLQSRLDATRTALFRRLSYYGVLGLFVAMALQQLGFNLGVLLGAAGIFTVALGFAAQTSVSNIISGLFLIGEGAIAVGDSIQVGTNAGEVLAIDLLSVKLRTFDNRMVRIPNETMIKTEVTNLTRFPIRRMDVVVSVAYKEDLQRVRQILADITETLPFCLQEPKPLIVFQAFGASSLDLQFLVWTRRENFFENRGKLQEAVKQAFDAQGIEIPFPHVSLYTGSVTEPFPVRMVESQVATSGTSPSDA